VFFPGGWAIAQASADQLADQGLVVESVDYLIRQDSFNPEEKRLFSHPCKMGSAAHKTKVAGWLARGGGIDGQPRGIYANHVQPYGRVRQLFVDLQARSDGSRD